MTHDIPILIVAEKPSALDHMAKNYRAVHGIDGPIHGITNGCMYQTFKFAYPRGLTVADYPLIRDPVYRVDPNSRMGCVRYDADNRRMPLGEADAQDLAQRARHIVLAGDADLSGYASQDVFLTQTFGPDWIGRVHEAPHITDLHPDVMRPQIESARRLPAHPAFGPDDADGLQRFLQLVEMGRTKRLIEYVYTINAIVLYGQVLRSLGIATDDWVISRWGVQLLYALRDQPPMSEAKILALMQRWGGPTPRLEGYDIGDRRGLGGPASRDGIVRDMVRAGLIAPLKPVPDREPMWAKDLALSPLGRAFLSRLHPDTEDPGLRRRITEWEFAGADARPMIERYYRTVFGKQKRFFKRHYQ
jgi:hypothetical protein